MLALFLLPTNFGYATEKLENTGLITRNIWYSKDPFFSGDRIRIYSVVFNGSIVDLRGRVNFFDKGTLLCTSEFAVLSGSVSNVWCDWAVKEGKHLISIKITNPRGSVPGGNETDVVLGNDELGAEEVLVGSAPALFLKPEDTTASRAITTEKTVTTENSSQSSQQNPGIIERALNLLGITPSNSLATGQDEVTVDAGVNQELVQRPSNLVVTKSDSVKSARINKAPNGDSANTLDKLNTFAINPKRSEQPFPQKLVLNNFASVWVTFKEFVSRVPYLGDLRDWILAKLHSFTSAGNKPLAYIALFVYTIIKFVLGSPIILFFFLLYFIWRICKYFIVRRRYNH